MGLIADIQNDIIAITSDANEFGVPITFIAPSGETETINGLHTRHFIAIEQREGNFSQQYGTLSTRANTRNAHISFSELLLSETGYPVRIDNEVNLKGHKCKARDNSGLLRTYVIMEWYPDETIGLIVCILNDYTE